MQCACGLFPRCCLRLPRFCQRDFGRNRMHPSFDADCALILLSRTKTDVLDCQWIEKLHSFGLLNGSFRPDQQIRKLRTYMRLRDNLVVASTQAVHHMQKALFEMNVQLSNVISDIVGETGLHILEAIIAGERDPKQLAALCSTRIKASRETVAKSLHGSWDEALLFALKAALETFRFSQTKIQECDCCIQQRLAQFESRAEQINSPQDLNGVRLTRRRRACVTESSSAQWASFIGPKPSG